MKKNKDWKDFTITFPSFAGDKFSGILREADNFKELAKRIKSEKEKSFKEGWKAHDEIIRPYEKE